MMSQSQSQPCSQDGEPGSLASESELAVAALALEYDALVGARGADAPHEHEHVAARRAQQVLLVAGEGTLELVELWFTKTMGESSLRRIKGAVALLAVLEADARARGAGKLMDFALVNQNGRLEVLAAVQGMAALASRGLLPVSRGWPGAAAAGPPGPWAGVVATVARQLLTDELTVEHARAVSWLLQAARVAAPPGQLEQDRDTLVFKLLDIAVLPESEASAAALSILADDDAALARLPRPRASSSSSSSSSSRSSRSSNIFNKARRTRSKLLEPPTSSNVDAWLVAVCYSADLLQLGGEEDSELSEEQRLRVANHFKRLVSAARRDAGGVYELRDAERLAEALTAALARRRLDPAWAKELMVASVGAMLLGESQPFAAERAVAWARAAARVWAAGQTPDLHVASRALLRGRLSWQAHPEAVKTLARGRADELSAVAACVGGVQALLEDALPAGPATDPAAGSQELSNLAALLSALTERAESRLALAADLGGLVAFLKQWRGATRHCRGAQAMAALSAVRGALYSVLAEPNANTSTQEQLVAAPELLGELFGLLGAKLVKWLLEVRPGPALARALLPPPSLARAGDSWLLKFFARELGQDLQLLPRAAAELDSELQRWLDADRRTRSTALAEEAGLRAAAFEALLAETHREAHRAVVAKGAYEVQGSALQALDERQRQELYVALAARLPAETVLTVPGKGPSRDQLQLRVWLLLCGALDPLGALPPQAQRRLVLPLLVEGAKLPLKEDPGAEAATLLLLHRVLDEAEQLRSETAQQPLLQALARAVVAFSKALDGPAGAMDSKLCAAFARASESAILGADTPLLFSADEAHACLRLFMGSGDGAKLSELKRSGLFTSAEPAKKRKPDDEFVPIPPRARQERPETKGNAERKAVNDADRKLFWPSLQPSQASHPHSHSQDSSGLLAGTPQLRDAGAGGRDNGRGEFHYDSQSQTQTPCAEPATLGVVALLLRFDQLETELASLKQNERDLAAKLVQAHSAANSAVEIDSLAHVLKENSEAQFSLRFRQLPHIITGLAAAVSQLGSTREMAA
jgi:hypothetical protein